MTRSQRKPSVGPLNAAGARWPFWLLIIGSSWAVAVAAAHLISAAQKIPLTFANSFAIFAREFSVGPLFFKFWCGHALRLLACLSFLAGVRRIGGLILRRMTIAGLPQDSQVESVVSLGLGLCVIAYLAFALLLLPGTAPVLLPLTFAGICIVGLQEIRSTIVGGGGLATKFDTVERILLIPLMCGLILAFVGTTAPEISYDALVYHLGVPQSYLLAGRLLDLPYNHYSYLPMLTSMLYIWGLAVDGMYMAKLINWSIGLALLQAIYAFVAKYKSRTHALAACALFITIPAVLYLHWMVNSDLGAALFLMLALICCGKWRDNFEQLPYLHLTGLFCGAAMATKYTTAIGVAFIGGYCLVRLSSQPIERKGRVIAGFFALSVLPLLPWWARNYLFQGNPFFPYAIQYFGGRSFDPELLRNWYAETRDLTPGLALLPHLIKVWQDATIGFENPAYNFVGPLVLGLAPLSLMMLGQSWMGAVLLASLGANFLGLSATHISRLLLPYVAVVATGASYCLAERHVFRPILLALFLALSVNNFYRWGQIFFLTSVKGLSVGLGQINPDQYLSKARNWYPDPSYGAFHHIDGLKLRKDGRVLVIGDSRTFYSPRLVVTNAPHDIPVAFAWANSAHDPRELLEKMAAENISVVVYNKNGSAHIDSLKYVNEHSSLMISSMFANFFNKIYEDDWTVVYQARANLQ